MRRRSEQSVTTDGYIIRVINPRTKGLRSLLDNSGDLTPDGESVVNILESLGYVVDVEIDD